MILIACKLQEKRPCETLAVLAKAHHITLHLYIDLAWPWDAGFGAPQSASPLREAQNSLSMLRWMIPCIGSGQTRTETLVPPHLTIWGRRGPGIPFTATCTNQKWLRRNPRLKNLGLHLAAPALAASPWLSIGRVTFPILPSEEPGRSPLALDKNPSTPPLRGKGPHSSAAQPRLPSPWRPSPCPRWPRTWTLGERKNTN